MKYDIYYIDAFTDKLFSGNPAAVIFSDISDSSLMQNIAAENNLSETAFIREDDGSYHIRWFSPHCEIDLCGHATLASAYVFFNYISPDEKIFSVCSLKNGILTVSQNDDLLLLDFPKDQIEPFDDISSIESVIGVNPIEAFKGRDDILAILESEDAIKNLNVDFESLNKLDARGLIVSSAGTNHDFVSRFFAPATGVDEDPVTGSAHTTLTPYWSQKLNKTNLNAAQLSRRGGVLYCEDKGDRVIIGGKATQYLKGNIFI
jgi:PhzF family phenazine biosynthesis protein